jgi:RimJ/RimL family protein N-acetyltransferase
VAQPVISLAGDKVAIGPLRRDLVPLYHAWISNLETTQSLSEAGTVVSLEEEYAWFESQVRKPDTSNFTIYALPNYQPIGTVNLHQINHRHHRANLGIMIGEPAMRGRGLGTEAVELAVDVGFNAMGLHSIWLTTYEFNIAGQRAYLKAGFRQVGCRRQCRYLDGRFWDELHYDLLATEFTRSRFPPRATGTPTADGT